MVGTVCALDRCGIKPMTCRDIRTHYCIKRLYVHTSTNLPYNEVLFVTL